MVYLMFYGSFFVGLVFVALRILILIFGDKKPVFIGNLSKSTSLVLRLSTTGTCFGQKETF